MEVTFSGGRAYVDLPNGVLTDNSLYVGGSGQFSLEVWASASEVQPSARLFDLGTSTAGEVNGPGGGPFTGVSYVVIELQPDGSRRVETAGTDDEERFSLALSQSKVDGRELEHDNRRLREPPCRVS